MASIAQGIKVVKLKMPRAVSVKPAVLAAAPKISPVDPLELTRSKAANYDTVIESVMRDSIAQRCNSITAALTDITYQIQGRGPYRERPGADNEQNQKVTRKICQAALREVESDLKEALALTGELISKCSLE